MLRATVWAWNGTSLVLDFAVRHHCDRLWWRMNGSLGEEKTGGKFSFWLVCWVWSNLVAVWGGPEGGMSAWILVGSVLGGMAGRAGGGVAVGPGQWGVVSRLNGWVILLAVEVGLCGFNSGQVWSSSLNEWNDWRFISFKKWSCRCKFTCYPAEINIFLTVIKELYQDAYGVVKVSYLSQWIIHSEFINSLSPLKSGFISSIREADWHGSMMLAINNAPRGVFKTLSNS